MCEKTLLFKALKQPKKGLCQHTVLAMLINESVKYVTDWFGSEDPLCGEDVIIFLAHHGLYLAVYGTPLDEEYITINDHTTHIDISMKVKGRPALVTVKSERYPKLLHAVFWTGYEVLDPSPHVTKPRKLKSYKIVEYWPLLTTEQRCPENAFLTGSQRT